MINIKNNSNFTQLNTGIKAVIGLLPTNIQCNINAQYSDSNNLKVTILGDSAEINFKFPQQLFRGIGLAVSGILSNEKQNVIVEEHTFKTVGIMYDCSRNSVPKVDTIKKILIRMALMGYNALMLYTEDTYEVENQPAFGQYRGRYSKTEIKAIDDFAFSVGIEVIPCIQALAHMQRFLRWPSSGEFKDIDHILLTNNDKTLEFIKNMIISISQCVRSRRIHLGLDEAHGLGLGKKLELDGYIKPEEIMRLHLEAVNKICKAIGLQPMMWGDMLFRMNIKGSGYYEENIELPKGTGDIIPNGMDVIYWDYYHNDEEFYLKYIDEHKKQGLKPVFAGGICSWIGMLPNLIKTSTTAKSSVSACKKALIDDMFLCVWKDNGGEGLPGADFLGMLMFAENCYNTASEDTLKRNALIMTGASYDAFFEVGSIDEITSGLSLLGLEPANPQKYFLWQDILFGQFDTLAENKNYASVYKQKAENIKYYIDNSDYSPDSYFCINLAMHLCSVLSIKVDLGVRLKNCYDKNDKKQLYQLKELIEGDYKSAVLKLMRVHRTAWDHFYKPFGWEVADIKYGYLLNRADTAVYRIGQYLDGTISELEELSHPRIDPFGKQPEKSEELPHFNNFVYIATPNQL
jgi:hexosaminidase